METRSKQHNKSLIEITSIKKALKKNCKYAKDNCDYCEEDYNKIGKELILVVMWREEHFRDNQKPFFTYDEHLFSLENFTKWINKNNLKYFIN